ncbi:MAG: hypothetical protein H0U77_06150 [Nocardioidaceae bacterium]|nr:hypothetical protein [Nocardioidaceae bacterium]
MADLDELADLIGPDNKLLTDPAVTDAYSRDQANLIDPGIPAAVLRAGCTAGVSTALQVPPGSPPPPHTGARDLR